MWTTIRLGILVTVAMAPACLAQPLKLYIAAKGSDANAGTVAAPFASFERARDAIRKVKKAGGLPKGGVTVFLRGGIYERDKPFELAKEDSGTADSPIVYRSYPGETARIVGGKVVKGWTRVTDPTVLARLPEDARGKVWQTNLREQGVADLGIVAVQDRKKQKPDQRIELFFNDEPMTLSRYPNDGFMRIVDLLGGKPRIVRSTRGDSIGKFTCDSDRLSRWVGEKELWVHGYWYWDWSDQRHKVKVIDPARRYIEVEEPYHGYGYRKGHWFYALNLLSEIDKPGEWYLDRETGVLYFYPPSPLDKGTAMVSVATQLVTMLYASHVTLERLTFEAVRGTAVNIGRSEKCEVVACTIRNVGALGVRIANGKECGAVGCDIYNSGGGGISLWGGDRKTLTPASHYAVNNHIHHYGLWNRMYQKAVGMGGVGHRAAHNLMHNAPHQAIGFWGNDHLIEFNEIHSVCFESNDAGAIYAGRDWTARGTVIRHNYMHHVFGFRSRGCVGVYLDDMFCGTEISGNVFHKVYRAAFIGGGRDCLVENNIFVDCPKALHIDARALGWAHATGDRWIKEAQTKGTLSGFKYKEPPYSTRWPALVTILEGEPKAPEGNVIRRNVFFGKRWKDVQRVAEKYITLEDNLTDEDPKFVDYEKGNFQLRDDSPAYAKIGFKRLPIEKIGLYQDERRASWPVEHKVRPMPEPPVRPARAHKGPAPVFKVARAGSAPKVDGVISPKEWPAASIALAEDVYGRAAKPVSRAWLALYAGDLYVAVRNEVDPKRALVSNARWGTNDAVEIAIQNPAAGKDATIFILRGYPDGRFESSTEAGAPEPEASALGVAAQYACQVTDPAHWTAEWRVPLDAVGIDAAKHRKVRFNVTARKMASGLWLMWCGTGAQTWRVDMAGVLVLAP